MNTQKAAYWIALAVFGLALHSEYQHGGFQGFHRAADRAGSTLCRLTTHIEQTFAPARVLTGQPALPADDSLDLANASELPEIQTELLSEQSRDRTELLREQVRARAAIIRAQVQLQRALMDQVRRDARSQVRISDAANRRVIVINPSACAKARARVAINSAIKSPDNDDGLF